MSRELNDLVPEFRESVDALLTACRARGADMRPSQTLRTPFEQGRLWRQSRPAAEISARVSELEADGAPFLSRMIREAGVQAGPRVTNAIPGLSWHQWGEALDVFWQVDGAAVWDVDRLIGGINGYRVYVEEALKLGLTAGGAWTRPDFPHVQLRPLSGPQRVYSMAEIDRRMLSRFG